MLPNVRSDADPSPQSPNNTKLQPPGNGGWSVDLLVAIQDEGATYRRV
jgi:hypothetical protein